VVFVVLAMLVVIGAAAGSVSAGERAGADSVPLVTPVQIEVLVDESGSITPTDLQREREAADLIALGEFSPASTIAVTGFGSDNGLPGQTPVDTVCPPTTVSGAQQRQALTDCIGTLHSRTKAEGYDTDHAAALQQAMSDLTARQSTDPKLVFLLTDGYLDVSNSPRYGPDNVGDLRDKAALAIIDNTLAQARQDGVEVWPLGFGQPNQVNRQQLDHFAAGGFQGSCGPTAARPSATVVGSSSDVARALLTAFSAARCAGIGEIQQQGLSSGQTVEEDVTIPPIATDGSIIVVKHDPRVTVTYVDPNGRLVPQSGPANGSVFLTSGANGPVEALRIVDPLPGVWKVHISSTPDVPNLDVSAVVAWQGAVRSVMSIDPPSPQPGHPVTVSLRLETRSRPITDPTTLRALSFVATMTVGGNTVEVRLADDGVAPDIAKDDGIYTGTATMPAGASGAVRFTGSVTGIGISGDTRTVDAQVASGPAQLTAVSTLSGDGSAIPPGGSLSGDITVANQSGLRRRVRLIIVNPAPRTLVTIPGAETVFTVPPTGTSTFPFHLVFGSNTALGANTATLEVVDDTDPNLVIHQRELSVVVAYPAKPPWLLIGIGVLGLILVVLAVLIIRYRRSRDVRGLVVYLMERQRVCGDLAAPERFAMVFRFLVQTEAQGVPLLTHDIGAGGDESYRLSRVGGDLRLRTPFDNLPPFHLGETVDIGQNLTLTVRDERARNSPDGDPVGEPDYGTPTTTDYLL
jgi:hypothetical protein